jgi:hypothetical protein
MTLTRCERARGPAPNAMGPRAMYRTQYGVCAAPPGAAAPCAVCLCYVSLFELPAHSTRDENSAAKTIF